MPTTEKYLDALVRGLAVTCQGFLKKGEETNPMFSLVKDNDVEMMVMVKPTSGDEESWRKEKHDHFWQVCQIAAAIKSEAILLVADTFYTKLEVDKDSEIQSYEDFENSDILAPSDDPRARECVMVQVGRIDGPGWCVFYPYLRMDDGRLKWEKVDNTKEHDDFQFEGPVPAMFKQALDPEFREQLPDLSQFSEIFGFDREKDAERIRYHQVRGAGRFLNELGHVVFAFGEPID